MKINLSRVLETSRFLSTEAGQQLSEFIQFMADLSERVLRALRNGLTIEDNMAGEVLTLTVKHGIQTGVAVRQTPKHVMTTRLTAQDKASCGLTGFSWWIAEDGKLTMIADIRGTPTYDCQLQVIVLY